MLEIKRTNSKNFINNPKAPLFLVVGVGLLALIAGTLSSLLPLISALLAGLVVFGIPICLILLKRPQWIIYGLSFSIAFQVSVDGPLGAEISPHLGIIAFSMAIACVLILKAKQQRFIKTPLLLIWLVYIGFSTVAIYLGPSIQGTLQSIWVLYRLVWSAPIVYIIVWLFLSDSKQVRWGVIWLILGAGIASLVGVVQLVTDGQLLSGLTTNYRYLGIYPRLPQSVVGAFSSGEARRLFLLGTHIFRAHGTFSGPNALGVFLTTTFFLGWGLFATAVGFKKVFWGVLLLSISAGLLATVSRSAWLATVVGVIVILLWSSQDMLRKRAFWITLLVFIIILAVIGGILLTRFPELIEHFTTIFDPADQSEVKWRIVLWQYAIDQIKQHPFFGVGTSMIDAASAGVLGRAEKYSSHNLLLDVAYQRGLVVFLLYSVFWLMFFIKGWQIIKYPGRKTTNFALGIIAAGVAFLVSGVGTPSMTYPNLSMLFWFLMAIMVVLQRNDEAMIDAGKRYKGG